MITQRESDWNDKRMAAIDARELQGFQGSAPIKMTAKSLAVDFLTGRDVDNAASSQNRLLLPYEQSGWVRRAIDLKVGEIASTEICFYAGESEYEDAAFAKWWSAPFLGQAARRLSLDEGRRELGAWLDLAGEYFILLGDDWLDPFAHRRGLQLSSLVIGRPDRMNHVVSKGEIIGWRFVDAGGRSHDLLPEQVVHQKLFNPYDDFRGLAPVKSIFNAAESDYLAGVYVRNLMRNNGDQGVYIIAKGGMPSDAQRDQIVASLREKKRRAQRGDFSAAFLTGDIAVEDPKAQAPNADLNATRLASRHEIFIGLGVPASMADIKASYSVGASSDRYQLITGTCIALAKLIDEPLGMIAARQTALPISASANWDDHPVMAEVREARVDSALKLWNVGMPIKAANDYLGLGMKPFTGWEKSYLPFSVSEVGSDAATDPKQDPALEEPKDDKSSDPAVEQLRLIVLARQRSRTPVCKTIEAPRSIADIDDPFAMFRCDCEAHVIRAGRDPKRIAEWKTHMGKRRESVKGFENAFGRVLCTARVETLRNIDAAKKSVDATVTKAAAVDLVFDLADFAEGFRAAMRNQQKNSLGKAGTEFFKEIGRDDAFTYPPAEVLDYLAGRQNKLKDVPNSIHEEIKAAIEESLVKGDTMDEIASAVRSAFNGIDAERGRRIAVTEVAAAYGSGRAAAMKQAGVKFKAWLTSGNANVRPEHLAAGEDYSYDKGIPIDEPFIVGGEELMHPGDDSGSPGNVINCHCISISVDGPDDETADE